MTYIWLSETLRFLSLFVALSPDHDLNADFDPNWHLVGVRTQHFFAEIPIRNTKVIFFRAVLENWPLVQDDEGENTEPAEPAAGPPGQADSGDRVSQPAAGGWGGWIRDLLPSGKFPWGGFWRIRDGKLLWLIKSYNRWCVHAVLFSCVQPVLSIRIDLAVLDPVPDSYWECGSGFRSMKIFQN